MRSAHGQTSGSSHSCCQEGWKFASLWAVCMRNQRGRSMCIGKGRTRRLRRFNPRKKRAGWARAAAGGGAAMGGGSGDSPWFLRLVRGGRRGRKSRTKTEGCYVGASEGREKPQCLGLIKRVGVSILFRGPFINTYCKVSHTRRRAASLARRGCAAVGGR